MKYFPPRPMRRRLVREELLPLSRFLAAALKDGSSAASALKAYASDARPWLRYRLELAAADAERGLSLSDSLQRLEGPLPGAYLDALKAGEASEDLPAALELAAGVFEHDQSLRARLTAPFVYAAALSFVMLVMAYFAIFSVMPVYESLYAPWADANPAAALPWPTVLFISLSPWARGLGYALPFAVLGAGALGWSGRSLGLAAKLSRLPPLAGVLRAFREVRFSLMFSRLLRTGAPLEKALELACRGSLLLGPVALEGLLKAVRGGSNLPKALAAAGASPELAWGVSLGEAREDLPGVLVWLADLQETRALHRLNCLVPVAERSANILLGLLVGFFAVAMYAPLFGLASLVGP